MTSWLAFKCPQEYNQWEG